MNCRNVLTRIDAMRTGELEKPEEHRVQEHLTRCSSCHESVDDLRGLASAVKGLKSRPPRSVLKRITDGYDVITTGDDHVWVAFSDRGISMIDLASESAEQFERKYQSKFSRCLRRAEIPSRYRDQVLAALAGKGPRNPDVDLSGVTRFEREVLRTILRIPRGQVRPYQWVARQVRRPKAVRAVGNVMAHNPIPLLLPCHRVVPSSGGLGSYAFGVARKRLLLSCEGCPVSEIEARKSA